MSSDGCYCQSLLAYKSAAVSAWDDFGERELNEMKSKSGTVTKGRKPFPIKSRYGYETLEDRYKFYHYEQLGKYMEDYSSMFSVCNRILNKKGWKTNGIPYNFLRMAPAARTRASKQKQPIATQNTEPDESAQSNDSVQQVENTNQGDAVEVIEKSAVQSPNFQAKIDSQLNHPAPPLGDCYQVSIDQNKDRVEDECEDDNGQQVPSKVPLVTQLNTFFLSRNGRRRTIQLSSASSSNLFPHIHSTCEPTSQDLGEMTPASIINYKVPSHERKRPTSHPKFSTQRNSDNSQPAAMFKPMYERQRIQMFPMRTKSLNASNLNHYEQLHSTSQTVNHKRFSALSLRREPETDKGLPKTHILTAKTISKSRDNTSSKPLIGKPTSTPSSWQPTSSSESAEAEKTRTKQNALLSFANKSLHPYLTSYSPVDKNLGKAELVDYSSIIANEYRT